MVAVPYEMYSDTVLYDVFYEAGTLLGARYISLSRQARLAGDEPLEVAYRGKYVELVEQRNAVHWKDRAGQIRCINSWNALLEHLPTTLSHV
ncbi:MULTISPECIES: hypothetical protein [Actinotignum]|uniref:Uncharacterized protein n=1 Tax=Actinotignum timonense TaxID=1870995 RepID=A0AAW9HCD3_9ACTO|nr:MULTISPECIES: hypothetical protein [Actinotignum]MDE1559286.1 hypothetical protein [Actinotignum schaalii]MDE1664270.1 hypothetical protein [Actinotignum schaalii]MDK6372772.1 hypothetical protein [Actinotignum timonense]MDK6419870.1 hypothetical protein [Actinotignum timonense]MDK6591135.1 hypothetical protein [Actinotignum timonense]